MAARCHLRNARGTIVCGRVRADRAFSCNMVVDVDCKWCLKMLKTIALIEVARSSEAPSVTGEKK